MFMEHFVKAYYSVAVHMARSVIPYPSLLPLNLSPVLNPTLSLLPHLSPSLPTYLSPLSPYNEIVAQTSKLILKTWHKFFETLCGRDSVLWDFGGPANVQNLFKTCLKCLFCL